MDYSYFKSKTFWYPTILFILFLIVYLILFNIGGHKYYSLTRTLTQWDGQLYLSVARDGYEKFPCEHNPNNICGNVGWFPFYPITAWLLSLTGININWSIIIISWLSLWLALLFIYKLVKDKEDEKIALVTLIALLVFPSSFYFLTAFPYALFLCLVSAIFLLVENKRFTFLFLLTALLAITYPSGIVIGLPLLYYLIKNWRKLNNREKTKISASLFSIGIALFLYGLYYWIKFDDFFLYRHFQAQSYYAHQISFPFVVIIRSLMDLKTSNPIFVSLLFTILVTILFYSPKMDIGWQLFMFGILLFTPTMGTTTSYYRQIIVAFPLFVLIGRAINSKWRKYLLGAYIVLAIYLMEEIFLPAYKLGQLM